MELFNKDDLMNGYEWKDYEVNAPEISGQPDSTLFNRQDGHQVLYIINKFSKKYEIRWKTSGLLLEQMLTNGLPDRVHSQIEVLTWIKKVLEKEQLRWPWPKH